MSENLQFSPESELRAQMRQRIIDQAGIIDSDQRKNDRKTYLYEEDLNKRNPDATNNFTLPGEFLSYLRNKYSLTKSSNYDDLSLFLRDLNLNEAQTITIINRVANYASEYYGEDISIDSDEMFRLKIQLGDKLISLVKKDDKFYSLLNRAAKSFLWDRIQVGEGEDQKLYDKLGEKVTPDYFILKGPSLRSMMVGISKLEKLSSEKVAQLFPQVIENFSAPDNLIRSKYSNHEDYIKLFTLLIKFFKHGGNLNGESIINLEETLDVIVKNRIDDDSVKGKDTAIKLNQIIIELRDFLNKANE